MTGKENDQIRKAMTIVDAEKQAAQLEGQFSVIAAVRRTLAEELEHHRKCYEYLRENCPHTKDYNEKASSDSSAFCRVCGFGMFTQNKESALQNPKAD